jgi:hypothetical protein
MSGDADSSDIVFDPSWPAPAQVLVRRAIDRHGGWSLWSRLRSVTINLVSLRGVLPWAKGNGRSCQIGRSLTTFPKAVRTEWREREGAPCFAVFDRGDMQLLDPDSGAVRQESARHRRTFRGLRKLRRWTPLDAHYFFGYAFASYTAVPFILPSLTYDGPAVGVWRGERLNGVRVRYPAGAEVHSQTQRYFFDAGGLIRRNDYVADVVGRFAVGAHFWDDYVTIDGLPLPTRRTVLRRCGRWSFPFPVVLGATFDRLAVGSGNLVPGSCAGASRAASSQLDRDV